MVRVTGRGRDLSAVCGDEVDCEYDAHHQELRVVALAPRSSALYRSNSRGGKANRWQPTCRNCHASWSRRCRAPDFYSSLTVI